MRLFVRDIYSAVHLLRCRATNMCVSHLHSLLTLEGVVMMRVRRKGKKGGKQPALKSNPATALPARVDDPAKQEGSVGSMLQPGQKLIDLLTSNPVKERELHGYRVSSQVLRELTPQEIRDLRTVFEIFDTDKDGWLQSKELHNALRVLGFDLTSEETRSAINNIASPDRRYINFNKFLEIIIDQQGSSRDVHGEITKGFEVLDYDKSGCISVDDLKQVCRDAGIKFTHKELEDMVEEADQNGDGQVDLSEFMHIMLQTSLF